MRSIHAGVILKIYEDLLSPALLLMKASIKLIPSFSVSNLLLEESFFIFMQSTISFDTVLGLAMAG